MRIKNMTSAKGYFGYGAVGAYLEPNAESAELPAALTDDPFLRADVEAGRISIVVSPAERAAKAFKPPEKQERAEPLAKPVAPAPRPATSLPSNVVNMIEAEVRGALSRYKNAADKRAYLAELMKSGTAGSRSLAEKITAELDATAPAQHTPTSPVAVPQAAPQSEPAPEPQVRTGGTRNPNPAPEPRTEEPKADKRTKPIAQMSKIDLMRYGMAIGAKVAADMGWAELKKAVAETEIEKGIAV